MDGLGSLLEQLELSGERCPGPLATLVDCLRKRPRLVVRLTGLISLSPDRSGLKCERESRRLREAESGLSESRRAFRPVSSTSGLNAVGCDPLRLQPPGGKQLSS